MLKFSIPIALLSIAACAQTPASVAEGGQAPSEPAAGVSEGRAGSGEAVEMPPQGMRGGPAQGEGGCDAEAARGLVGREASDASTEEAMRLSGAKSVRVIPHDGVVTMDYSPTRLNIQLDERRKIVAITCG